MRQSAPQFPLTRSRSSLPGLKCGTYLADTMTATPVLGLRPLRKGRRLIPKLPNPRTSTRLHLDADLRQQDVSAIAQRLLVVHLGYTC